MNIGLLRVNFIFHTETLSQLACSLSTSANYSSTERYMLTVSCRPERVPRHLKEGASVGAPSRHHAPAGVGSPQCQTKKRGETDGNKTAHSDTDFLLISF